MHGERRMHAVTVPLDHASDIEMVYKDLLLPAFPPNELITIDELQAGVASGAIDVVASVNETGTPVACAIGESPTPNGVALLAYLAVRQELRAAGLGSKVLLQAIARWTKLWEPGLILVEIENPVVGRGDPAHGDPFARLRFYARHGVQALDVPYFQPALPPSHERVYGMLLAVIEVAESHRGTDPNTVSAKHVQEFMVEYLNSTEGCVGSDPACIALFDALDRPRGIRLLPLSEPSALPCSSFQYLRLDHDL